MSQSKNSDMTLYRKCSNAHIHNKLNLYIFCALLMKMALLHFLSPLILYSESQGMEPFPSQDRGRV